MEENRNANTDSETLHLNSESAIVKKKAIRKCVRFECPRAATRYKDGIVVPAK